jgi:phage shock protein PspC (stress-responsive transcriptional regulator)
MQRVVSINLNGNAYQLEENGYNALFAYLDAADAQLKDSPERAQMVADLEARVAELCQAYLSPHKTVVTSMDVDRIIAQLGAQLGAEPGPIPGQPDADAGRTGAASQTASGAAGAGAGTRSGSSSAGPFAHRRLYQIREGSMISGVCMGLAEYMHIDVTIIRIMFVIFALVTSGWGIIAYAALMFVVPRVDTRAAAGDYDASGTMPPHRWPWDDGWWWDKHGWPWDKHGWPWDQPSTQRPQSPGAPPQPGNAQSQAADLRQQARDARAQARDVRREARDARHAWRAERRTARMGMAYHPVSNWWGMFGMIICIVFAVFWLSLWTRGRLFFGWPYFWGFPHWVGIVIFFMVMRFIFMPFRMSRWHGYGYGFGYGPYAHPHYGWVAMWNGLAWFAMMMFGIWLAYHYIPEFHDFIRSFQTSWRDGSFRV